MKLSSVYFRAIPFAPIWGASGVQGFFGEGYQIHGVLHHLPGFDFTGMSFVSKTTTLNNNLGYMPLQTDGITPKDWFPKCVIAKPLAQVMVDEVLYRGVVLNAVGLSGPGSAFLLNSGRWQARSEPFQISFMAIGKTLQNRLQETKDFVKTLAAASAHFRSKFALQINLSCPNVGRHENVDYKIVVDEALKVLDIVRVVGIPIILKFNILIPPSYVKDISEHPACDAICVTNTIPWGALPETIRWREIFGSEKSPLEELGFAKGGLSGPFLKPLVCNWIREARRCGLRKHINGGGGICCADDVDDLKAAGASSVFLGATATMLRPWRVQLIVQRAHELWKVE